MGVDVRDHGDGILVAVQVRPRSQPGLAVTDAGIVIRVASPPEKGRATEEARHALAASLGVSPTAVALRTGATARRKTFVVEGISATEARARILERARSEGG